jgi:uncharacterized membrane protein
VPPVRADEVLLTVHILAVAAWIGAALALQVIGARIGPRTEDVVIDRFAVDAEAMGRSLLAPASVLVLITGVALVVREDVSWTAPWILFGIGVFVVTGAIGGAYLIPEARRIAELARAPGHDPAEVRVRSRRRLLVARVDLSLLVLAVAAMVFRVGD